MERLDVVIFGATGLTGKYAVKELNKIAKEQKLTWGIAGRSEDKLKNVLSTWTEKTGDDFSHVKVIVADIKDEDSLKKMTEQAKVIVNCCGPYRFFGEPVIKACLETGTHHVDVSAEEQYMERMELEYNKAAQDKGIYIISSCGFGSVPADLGVIYLQDNFDGTVNSVDVYVNIKPPKSGSGPLLHYGTWESGLYVLAHTNELKPLRAKLYSTSLPKFEPKAKSHGIISRSPIVDKSWIIPFLGSDAAIIRRTQRHFYDQEKKRPAQVHCYMVLFAMWTMFFFGAIFGILSQFSYGRHLLLKYPKFFSGGWVANEGPSDTMEGTKFEVSVVGKGWPKDKAPAESTDQHTDPPNKKMVIKVSGINPGYGDTNVMILMCGLTLLKETDKMPGNGGVLTPGAAFAKTSLIQQLHRHGVTFEVVSGTGE